MFIELDRNNGIPVKKQLYDAITLKILRGELARGEKLPSSRELADRLNIARNSVIEIYEQLVSEAYLETVRGKGTFVSGGRGGIHTGGVTDGRVKPEKVIRKNLIDFRCGIPDLGSFPRKAWLRALKESLEDAQDDELGYGSFFGYGPLRRSLAEYLLKYKGISCSYRQIVIVNGTSDAIALLAVLFRKSVSRVLVESAVVSFVPDIFREFGYDTVPVRVDRHGICTKDLPEAEGCLVFTSPSHQFPLGGTLSAERRRELADHAGAHGHYIIEDDYDSEFRYAGAPVNSLCQLAPDNVIHLGTFSKTLAPFLRLGYMVLPERLVPQVKRLQRLLNRRVNTHEQMALNHLMEEGIYVRHVNRVCKLYKRKMQTVTSALHQEFGDLVQVLGVNSGLHVAAVFPGLLFDSKSRKVFLQHEVDVELLSDYTIERQETCDTLILGFGHLSEAGIREGIRRLRSAVDELEKN